MPQSAAAADTAQSFFNVIFHGPFIFAIYPNRVEVLAAEIEEHIFGAGTYQKERPCAPGTYSVIGIKSAQSSLGKVDPDRHLVLDAGKTEFQIAPKSYYRFVLPPPSFLIPLGLLSPKYSKDKVVFIGKNAGAVTNPTKFGSAHALSYNLSGKDKDGHPVTDQPELEIMQWAPEIQKVGDVQAINLHIFAESPYQLDLLHPTGDFTTLVAYLAGLSLGIQRPFPEIISEPNTDAVKYGINNDEQSGLRGPRYTPLFPPRICDSPSLMVTNATDTAS